MEKITMRRWNCCVRILAFSLVLVVMAGCQRNSHTGGNAVIVTDAQGNSVSVADSSRIVSIGTSGTETLYALGAGPRLVGIDNSSAEYIPEAASLPKVGTRTALSTEGILSLKPTLVIVTTEAGPAQVVDQLRSAGVTTLVLPTNFTVETVKQKVQTIGRAVGQEQKANGLNREIDDQMAQVNSMLSAVNSKPRVLFVGRGPNMPNATMSGSGTTIDEMIRLAGGTNPMTDFKGFKEMTDEAVISAGPDVVLMTEKSFERSGGVDGVLKFPGVSLTPAGKERRVVTVSDMYFQGFGPGVGKAVRELALKLHPELSSSGKTETSKEAASR
jgi:iron complex transport system substrate-binding protein